MIPPFKSYPPKEPTLQDLAGDGEFFTHYYHLQFVQNEKLKLIKNRHDIIRNFQIQYTPVPVGVTTASIYLGGTAIQTMCAHQNADDFHKHLHFFTLNDIGNPPNKVVRAYLDGELGYLTTVWKLPVDFNVEIVASYEYEWGNKIERY